MPSSSYDPVWMQNASNDTEDRLGLDAEVERLLAPGGRYPDWQQTIAARSVMPMFTYRPGRAARRIRVPLLVVVAEQDQSVLAKPAVRAATRANAALLKVPGGHYAPFLEQHETVAEAELSFFLTHLSVGRP